MAAVTSAVRDPLITGGKTVRDVSHDISRHVENKPTKLWYIAMAISLAMLGWGFYCVCMLLWHGIGMWGLNKTVGWAWDITNFVWWVGIGHAGTLISAILLLFRQRWRMSINRAAEAMTIFAVICAASFPALHMGRLWLGFYWALPLPNALGSLWVNFNSPLLWDVFAISTYFTVSLVFWYIGLIPDFATIRDRAVVQGNKIRASVYNALSFGWEGGAKTWMRYESVALILAGLSTRRSFNTACIVRSHDRINGLRDFGNSWLAYNNLPAVLRCRCDLLRFCNGIDTSYCDTGSVQAGRLYHNLSH
jgi:Ni/Fe-hydrogenase subunit HybB-like protein